MKMIRRKSWESVAVLICGVLLWAVLPIKAVASENSTPRDQAEAWKWMEDGLKRAGIKDPKLEDGNVSGQLANGAFVINLAMVSSVKQVVSSGSSGIEWYQFPNISVGPGHVYWRNRWSPADSAREARRFEAAFNFLVLDVQASLDAKAAAKFDAFKLKAAEWRQQPLKPEMPEEAHRHQVLAENAYQSKNVSKTIIEYGLALQAFPYWAEGHYNLAALAGEIGSRPGYYIAVHHMKEYLELMPDAPDARAAKDSIIVWQDKGSLLAGTE